MVMLQRTLELAAVLSKVKPQLERLHLVEPKKGHRRRKMVLVATTVAVGAVVAGVVCRARGCRSGATAGNEADARAAAEQNVSAAEPDPERPATEADEPRDTAALGRHDGAAVPAASV